MSDLRSFKHSIARTVGLPRRVKALLTLASSKPEISFSPKFLVFPVTYRCNLRCKTCFCAEQSKEIGELTLSQINACLRSLSNSLRHPLENINLTGGELFLRDDIVEIVRCLSSYGTKIIGISTNGLNVRKICDTFELLLNEFPYIKWNIQVSLDGPEEIHNSIRGNKKSFECVMLSLACLLKLKKKYSFGLSTNMTISKENITSVKSFYQWLQAKWGNHFSSGFTFSVDSNLYISSQNSEIKNQFKDEEYLTALREVGTWLYREKDDLFALDVALMTRGYDRFTPCVFQDEGYFLEPNGNIYKCSVYRESLIRSGLNERPFDIVEAYRAFNNISHKCPTCLNNCGNYIRSKGYLDFMSSEYVQTREKIFLDYSAWDILTPLIFRKMGIDFIRYKGQSLGDKDLLLVVRGSKLEEVIYSHYYDLRYFLIPAGLGT